MQHRFNWHRGTLLYWRRRLKRAGRKQLLMYLLGLIAAVEFFENAMFVFGATYIMGGVDAEPQEFVHAQATYAIGSMVSLLLQPRMVHRFGYRSYLFGSILLFLLGMLACANSASIGEMSAARFLLGLGGGVFFASGRILVVMMFPPAERPAAVKRFLTVVFGTSALAPAYAALVIDRWGWAWTFYGALPGTLLIGVGVLLLLPKDLGRVKGARLVGDEPLRHTLLPLLWFALAVICLEIAFSQARLDVLTHPTRLVLIGTLGILLLVGFLWRQWQHPMPLLNVRLLHSPVYLVGLGLYFVHYFITGFIAYLFPIYAERGLGIPLITTGWLTSFMGFATLVTALTYTFFVARRLPTKRPVMIVALTCVIISALWFSFLSPQAGVAELWPALVLKGIFGALFVLPVAGQTFRELGDARFAHGYQSKTMMRQMAMTFASALAAVMLQNRQFALSDALAAQIQPTQPGAGEWISQAEAWLLAQGMSPSQVGEGVLTLLAEVINKQAMLQACQDLYLLLALFAALAVVVVMVQRKLK